MLTTQTIISKSWVPITTVGQQGSCWIFENSKGSGGVVISHSNTGSVPTSARGFRVYKPNDNTNIAIMGPDDANDIYYARCLNDGERVKLCIDVI